MARFCAERILAGLSVLTEQTVARNLAANPQLETQFGPTVRAAMNRDTDFHLRHLAEAVGNANPKIFSDYLDWLKVLLAGYGVGTKDIALTMTCLRDTVVDELGPACKEAVLDAMAPGLASLAGYPRELPPFVQLDQPHSGLANLYLSTLLKGKRRDAEGYILNMVRAGIGVDEIYIHVFQRTQREVGRLWQLNHISVAQEHFCTAVTQALMSRLYPMMLESRRPEARRLRCLATCVAGDLHALGMNMVSDFLEMNGWECLYTGANTPTPAIIDLLRRDRFDVLLISATMTFHVSAARDLIKAVRGTPGLRRVRVVVGGNPFNEHPRLWRDIGADAHAADAPSAIEVLNRFEMVDHIEQVEQA